MIRAAHHDRGEPYSPSRELAKNVLEVALRDALLEYSPGVVSSPKPEQQEDARVFLSGDDLLPWAQLAWIGEMSPKSGGGLTRRNSRATLVPS